MKKIILINPAYPGSPFPSGNWPVGLGYIAKSLESIGAEYRIIDLNFETIDFLISEIKYFQPEFIGISMMTCAYNHTYNLLKKIKECFPTMKIVVGGPHISYLRETVLQDCPEISYGIVLEGEETIIELMENEDVSRMRGILYREGARILYNGDRNFIENLDSIPFPTYNGFRLERYSKTVSICSSRGCPYNCIFCGASLSIGKKWRGRSPQNLINEIEYWYEKGYRNFSFIDSNFSFDKKRVHEFCDEIGKRKFKNLILGSEGVRADKLDREILEKMRSVGFRHLAIGVESGNNKILKNLKKGERIEVIEEVIRNATEFGFHVILFFVIGAPGETEEDIEDSFRLAWRYPVSTAYFFGLTPLPKTELFDWVEKNGYFLRMPEEYIGTNYGLVREPIYSTPLLSSKQIKKFLQKGRKLQKKIERRFRYKRYSEALRKLRLGFLSYIIAFIFSFNFFGKLINRLPMIRKLVDYIRDKTNV